VSIQRYRGAVVETSCTKEVGRLWKGKRERDLVFFFLFFKLKKNEILCWKIGNRKMMVSEKGYILHCMLTLGFCDSQANADSIIFIQIRKM